MTIAHDGSHDRLLTPFPCYHRVPVSQPSNSYRPAMRSQDSDDYSEDVYLDRTLHWKRTPGGLLATSGVNIGPGSRIEDTSFARAIERIGNRPGTPHKSIV